MAFNLFNKKKQPKKAPSAAKESVAVSGVAPLATTAVSSGALGVLEGIYVSEKASHMLGMNKYVFRITNRATAPEIAKHVHRLYNVKVARVQVISLPHKRRDIGRHPGTKSGFRKAIVTLKSGESIAQAQP